MLTKLKAVMTWLCILPATSSLSFASKALHVIFALVIFTVNACCVIASFAYIVKFISDDLEGSLFALIIACGLGSTAYVLAIATIKRYEMAKICQMLSAIYTKCKWSSVHRLATFSQIHYNWMKCIWLYLDGTGTYARLLNQANETSEWICEIYFKINLLGFLSMAGMPIIVACICWLRKDCTDYVFHPINIMLIIQKQNINFYSLGLCFAFSVYHGINLLYLDTLRNIYLMWSLALHWWQ